MTDEKKLVDKAEDGKVFKNTFTSEQSASLKTWIHNMADGAS